MGEHVHVNIISADIISAMEVFSYLYYVRKWKRGEKEKVRKNKKEYGIIEVQDMSQRMKVLLI